MAATRTPRLGLMFPCTLSPARLPAVAALAQDGGLDELWLAEDCFFSGGIAMAATALAATTTLRVGIGILPAAIRNPAFVAMELATLDRVYPGRLMVGLGHGMTDWMRQVGALPASPLTMLDETLTAVRSLLAGERVNTHGRYVRLSDVQLAFPAVGHVPVLAGVRGPRSLELSGRRADGTILAEPTPTGYVKAVRTHIDRGRAAAGSTWPHRLVAYAWYACDQSSQRARDQVAEPLARGLRFSSAHLADLPYAVRLRRLLETITEPQSLARALPAEWIDDLAVVGSAEQCLTAVRSLAQAGADTIVLIPAAPADLPQVVQAAAALAQDLKATGATP